MICWATGLDTTSRDRRSLDRADALRRPPGPAGEVGTDQLLDDRPQAGVQEHQRPGRDRPAITGVPRGVRLATLCRARRRALRVDRPEGGPPADLVPPPGRRVDPARGAVRDVAAFPG